MAYQNVTSDQGYEYSARSANGRRHRKRRKRRQSFFNTFFLIVLGIVAVLLIFATLFRVDEIVIEGDTRYEHSQIKSLSGILYGDNIYNIDKEDVIFNIESNLNYIENVEVKTDLFGTVVISVDETRPAFAIADGNRFILLSAKLKIIDMNVDMLPQNVPILNGIEVIFPEQNMKLRVAEEDLEKEQILMDLISYIELSELKSINKIDVSEVLNIKMEYDSRVVILLGTKNKLKRKIENVKYIIDTEVHEKNFYCIETVFQESDVPRSSIRPITSLEDFYNGRESVNANYSGQTISESEDLTESQTDLDEESEPETDSDQTYSDSNESDYIGNLDG